MTRSSLVVGLLLAGGLGCGEQETSVSTRTRPPPVVEMDGCQEVRGEVCVLRSEPSLTLWVGPLAADADCRFRADGEPLPPRQLPVRVQGGSRFQVSVPPSARRLEVLVDGNVVASLPFEPSTWPPELTAAARQVRKNPSRARALFADCPESLGPRARPACWTLLAKALPPSPERDAALEQAITGHRAAGHQLGTADTLALAASHEIDGGQLEAATALLKMIPTDLARTALLRTYSEGLLARKQGQVGRALDQLTEAGLIAERLGRDYDLFAADQERALALGEIGRFRSVVEILERLADRNPTTDPCLRLDLWLNVGWTRYLAREQGEDVADPVAALERARPDLAEPRCPSRRFLFQVNLALALLQAGRLYEAEQALSAYAAEGAKATAEERWWFGMAEANLALARGRREEALAGYDRLARLEVPEAEWRALFGRALALGKGDDALAALSRAEGFLDERLATVPPSEGREWLVAQSEPIARRELSILLDRGREAEALLLVRRVRARVLRNFLPSAGPAVAREAFSPPSPGELLLAFHPVDESQWALFAQEAKGPPRVIIVPLPTGRLEPSAALSTMLLAPFEAEIGRSQRLRILPYGRLRDLDFHGLPWGSGLLLDALPVAYGLDLPERRKLRSGGANLVVGDPRGDLPQAAQEAEEVVRELAASGRQVVRLVGLEANAERVRSLLEPGIELLHFAGHADFEGPGGWQSELRLAHGSRLTLEDLLTLERPPDWVVLSACESGKTTTEARVDGLGLAQTFLLGGSRGVIATSRPIEDSVARSVVKELYRAWIGGSDLSQALRTAQLRQRDLDPEGHEWAAFRLFEP